MAEVGINIHVREDGSVDVRNLGDEFKKAGEIAEDSAKKTTGAWDKVKGALGKVDTAAEKTSQGFNKVKSVLGKVDTAADATSKGLDMVNNTLGKVDRVADKTSKGLDKVNSTLGKVDTIAEKTSKGLGKVTSILGKIDTVAKETANVIDLFSAALSSIKNTVTKVVGTFRKLREKIKNTDETVKAAESTWEKFGRSLNRTIESIKTRLKGFIRQVFSVRGAIATLAGTAGIGALVKSFIGSASEMENFKTRLISMTKSSEIAGQKLKALSDFAEKAPFELPQIIKAGVTLEAFGAKAEKIIKPLGDLAAFMGTGMVEAASAYGRAFAAGAGAADILRDRGVLAMVKLKAGIEDLSKLTLPEFRKILLETLTDPDGKIFGATKKLAETYAGQMSMMTDAVFRMKVAIGTALMPAIKDLITTRITPLIKRIKEWGIANEEIIKQKFDSFIRGTADAIEKLAKTVNEVGTGTSRWWTENMGLIVFLGQLYIATKIATMAVTAFVKVLLVVKVLSFAKATGLLAGALKALGATSTVISALFVAIKKMTIVAFLLKTAIGGVALGFVSLMSMKVGAWISDWIGGIDKFRKTIKAADKATAKLKERMGKKLGKLGFADIDAFNKAVKDGLVVFDEFSGAWEKVKEKGIDAISALSQRMEDEKIAAERLAKVIKAYANEIDNLGDKYLKIAQTRFADNLKRDGAGILGLSSAMRRYQAVITETFQTRREMYLAVLTELANQQAAEEDLHAVRIAMAKSEMAGTESLLDSYRNYYAALGQLRDKYLTDYKKKLDEITKFEQSTLKVREQINSLINQEEKKFLGESRTEQEKYYDKVTALENQYTAVLQLTGKERLTALEQYIKAVASAANAMEAIRTGVPPEVPGVFTNMVDETALDRMREAQEEWERTRKTIVGSMRDSAAESLRAAKTIEQALDQAARKIDFFVGEVLAMAAEIENLQMNILVSVNDQASPVIEAIKRNLDALHDKTISINIRKNYFSGNEDERILGSFHSGTPYVPQTGPYLLQRGEAVVPANRNPNPNNNNDHRRYDQRQFTVNFTGPIPEGNRFEEEVRMLNFFNQAASQGI